MIPAAFPSWTRAEALGASRPEFAPFQDEPIQMRSGTVGKTGFLRLGFESRSDRTILAKLERRAPYMVQRALHCDEEMPGLASVFLITTTGCVLQGDRFTLDIALGPRAQAHITSQSATKIHAMDANYAAQSQTITLADDAYLEFLPDPVIPHRHSRFLSDTQISVAPSATLLLFGDHSTRPQAPSSGRVLRSNRVVDINVSRAARWSCLVRREADHRAAAIPDAADRRDGLL